MRILVLTDIHANLKALQAILKKTANERIDVILSMGDQVNYCPWPAQTLALLRDQNALIMLGNHDARLRALKMGTDTHLKQDYNWSLLRFTHRMLPDETFIYPADIRYKHIHFTHAMPYDVNHLIEPDQLAAFEHIANALPEEITTVITGHNHLPWHIEAGGKTFINSGSSGLLEEHGGQQAGYLIIDDSGQDICITPYQITYDSLGTKEAFIDSGAAKEAPEFCRLVLEQIDYGYYKTFPSFIQTAIDVADAHHLDWRTQEAFRLADDIFPWSTDIPTDRFWN